MRQCRWSRSPEVVLAENRAGGLRRHNTRVRASTLSGGTLSPDRYLCLSRPAACVLNSDRECRDHREGQHDRRMSERIFSWRSLAGAAVPPRDPDDDDKDEEEDDADEDDDREPANQTKISHAGHAALLDSARDARRSLKWAR
jgi:hypothetical protein